MKLILNYIIKYILSCFVAITFLSLFCIVYSYSGIHITNYTNATDYKWQANQYKATMTEGHAWMRFDKNGFNNINSSIDSIDILIMGSSHMEAVQIKQKNNLTEILNKELNYNVYNIGMSGHQLYNIVNNYDDAINYYHPNKYVIIETDRVDLDEITMDKVINNEYNRIKSYDSGIMYYLQKIPAIKLIYKQLQDWMQLEKNEGVITEKKQSTNYETSLLSFLSIISTKSEECNIKPIIFYHPTEKLNKDGSVYYLVDQEKLALFSKKCKDLDIIFIDMSQSFEKLYYNEHVLAHGFNNTHVGTGHLNKYGHRVISEEIIKIINKLEND